MVLFILLSSSISNILDTYALVIDPLYLLVFSYVIDKSLPLAYHVFYSFYTTIIVELSFRIVAYTVLSAILRVSISHINASQWLVAIYYLSAMPCYLFIHYLLHIDYEAIRLANGRSKALYYANGIMIVFFIFVNGSTFLESHIAYLPYSVTRMRYLFIFVYALLFLWSLYQFNSKAIASVESEAAMERQNHYRNLSSYNTYIATLYGEITHFKKQTKDSLIRFGQVLDTGDMEQVKSDFNQLFSLKENPFNSSKYDLERLINVKIPILKSFLASKLFEAQTQGLHLTVEVPDDVTGVAMELLDLMIIISVFCDNAIEAAKESHDKKMNFVLFELDDMLVFVIENSTQEEKVDIGAIFKKGYSTKGAERGLGLDNVRTILEAYPCSLLSTKSSHFMVTQTLKIPKA